MIQCEDNEGNIFDSKSDMCKAHGTSIASYSYRKIKGLPLEKCLKPYKSPFVKSKEEGFVYKNKRYKSMFACCEEIEVSYHAVYGMLKRNDIDPVTAIDRVIANKKKSLAKKSA